MATTNTAKPSKTLPPAAHLERRRSSRHASQDAAVGAAKELHVDQVVEVRLSYPDETNGRVIAEFQVTLTEAFKLFLDKKLVVAKPQAGRRSPTPRLRRAIANTEKIVTPRFSSADELFASLEKRGKK
jgi:hypothetical protein